MTGTILMEPFFLRQVTVPGKRKRHHHKSRGGCITCKARRVKCDEEKPACRRCQATDRQCEGYQPPKTRVFLPGEQQEWPINEQRKPSDASISENELSSQDEETADTSPEINSNKNCSPYRSSLSLMSPKYGVLDPFLGPSIEHESQYVNNIMRFAIFGNWPELFAGEADLESLRRGLIQRTMSSPMLFKTTFWFNAQVYEFRLGEQQDQAKAKHEARIAALVDAARLAAAELQVLAENPQEKPSDELITVVLMLASCPELLPWDNGSSNPLSPVQHNDLFGFIGQNKHDNALELLVRRKGGLGAIDMPGIPRSIVFRGLLEASVSSQKPRYPMWWGSRIFSQELDSSYHSSLILAGVDANPASVFCKMRKLIELLNDSANEEGLSLADLVIARAEVQHELLSLQPSPCRTAALIFSDLAVFPLPSSTGVRQKLASDFQMHLTDLQGSLSLQLWITSMVAMNSPDHCSSELFTKMCELVVQLSIHTFEQFAEVLKMYLWWDATCNELGWALWQRFSGLGFVSI